MQQFVNMNRDVLRNLSIFCRTLQLHTITVIKKQILSAYKIGAQIAQLQFVLHNLTFGTLNHAKKVLLRGGNPVTNYFVCIINGNKK